MSGSTNEDAPDPRKTSIFDERPGVDESDAETRDDPNDPGAIAPNVIAPDLGDPVPFDDRSY